MISIPLTFFFLIHFGQENPLFTYCSSANPYTFIKSPAIDCQVFKDRPVDRNRLVGHPCSNNSDYSLVSKKSEPNIGLAPTAK